MITFPFLFPPPAAVLVKIDAVLRRGAECFFCINRSSLCTPVPSKKRSFPRSSQSSSTWRSRDNYPCRHSHCLLSSELPHEGIVQYCKFSSLVARQDIQSRSDNSVGGTSHLSRMFENNQTIRPIYSTQGIRSGCTFQVLSLLLDRH